MWRSAVLSEIPSARAMQSAAEEADDLGLARGQSRPRCRSDSNSPTSVDAISRVAVDFRVARSSSRGTVPPLTDDERTLRMLGRKSYTQEELDHAKTAIDQ
jgi:hypothetical protein